MNVQHPTFNFQRRMKDGEKLNVEHPTRPWREISNFEKRKIKIKELSDIHFGSWTLSPPEADWTFIS